MMCRCVFALLTYGRAPERVVAQPRRDARLVAGSRGVRQPVRLGVWQPGGRIVVDLRQLRLGDAECIGDADGLGDEHGGGILAVSPIRGRSRGGR
jgi:hypothetical protein